MPPVKKPARQRLRHFIREWRDYRGLNQEQAAAKIGVSATTWGRIENGKVPYNQDFLEEAAHALMCRPWDLLNRDPREEGDLVDAVHNLDPEDRAEAQSYVHYLKQRNHR